MTEKKLNKPKKNDGGDRLNKMESSKTIKTIEELLDVNESYKVPEKIMNIMFDKETREEYFWRFMKNFDYDLSYDWFQQDFEENHADRGKSKQDFTPKSITNLLHKLIGLNGTTTFEPAAGNGGIIISRYAQILEEKGLKYNPSDYFYVAEDLNDRSMPFLLFNLTIRGMNAVVLHVDSITRECKGILLILNSKNNSLGFSDFNVMPYTEKTEKYFNVKFVEKYYKEHVESELFINEWKYDIRRLLWGLGKYL